MTCGGALVPLVLVRLVRVNTRSIELGVKLSVPALLPLLRRARERRWNGIEKKGGGGGGFRPSELGGPGCTKAPGAPAINAFRFAKAQGSKTSSGRRWPKACVCPLATDVASRPRPLSHMAAPSPIHDSFTRLWGPAQRP